MRARQRHAGQRGSAHAPPCAATEGQQGRAAQRGQASEEQRHSTVLSQARPQPRVQGTLTPSLMPAGLNRGSRASAGSTKAAGVERRKCHSCSVTLGLHKGHGKRG